MKSEIWKIENRKSISKKAKKLHKFLAKSEKPHKKLPKTAEPHTPDTPRPVCSWFSCFLGLCLCDFEILCLAIFVSSWYICWFSLENHQFTNASTNSTVRGVGDTSLFFWELSWNQLVKCKIFFNRCVVKHSKNGKIKNPVLMQN